MFVGQIKSQKLAGVCSCMFDSNRMKIFLFKEKIFLQKNSAVNKLGDEFIKDEIYKESFAFKIFHE
jgi:hypothetical protein